MPRIDLVSGPTTVWTTGRVNPSQAIDACEWDLFGRNDIPRYPAFMIRNHDDEYILYNGNHYNYKLDGPSPTSLVRDCTAGVYESSEDPDYVDHDYKGWLNGPFVDEEYGKVVYALAHQEWHGEELYPYPNPGTCYGGRVTPPPGRSGFNCWFGSTIALKSVDGGHSFIRRNQYLNQHIVLAAPQQTEVLHQGKLGLNEPSNIFHVAGGGPNGLGYFYMFLHAFDTFDVHAVEQNTACLARTAAITQTYVDNGTTVQATVPQGDWLAYRVTSTSIRFDADIEKGVGCTPVIYGASPTYVLYVADKNTYIAVRFTNTGSSGANRISYFHSTNLIHWTGPTHLIEQLNLPYPNLGAVGYPSLMDHNSPSRNMYVTSTNSSEVYLYYVEWLGHNRNGGWCASG